MLEVQIHPTGDRAEAETAEAAVFAAITLVDDARTYGLLTQGMNFTATFYGEDGRVVRANVPDRHLWAAAGARA